MNGGKRLENVPLGDQSLIALTALRRRTSGDLGQQGKLIEIKICVSFQHAYDTKSRGTLNQVTRRTDIVF